MFLKLLLVEERINLKASQILIVAVGSNLKETDITFPLLTARQIDYLAQLRLAESCTVS